MKPKFLSNEYIEKPVDYWTYNDLLNYTIVKMKKEYNIPFQMTFAGKGTSPSDCQQVVMMRKIFRYSFHENPVELKEYIDWCFNLQNNRNQTIWSVAFFGKAGNIGKFKAKPQYIKNNSIPNRTDILPSHLQIDSRAKNYGELSFLIQAEPQIKSQISSTDLIILEKIT